MAGKSALAWIAVLAVGGAGYAIYDPTQVGRWSPRGADLARDARVRLGLPAGAAEPAKADAAPPPSAAPVEAQAVVRKDFPILLEALGEVAPYNTVTVKARVDGQVTHIAFKEGQMVKAGDLLAEIDPRPFQAALDQTQAKKQQDEANLANAKLDLTRYSTLAKQSFASQQQLDTQSALVNQLTAQIAADAASVDAAAVQLAYTRISAPLTGRVGFRLIDQGNMVAASQQTGIVVIDQLQPIAVTFPAPEEQVGEINQVMRSGEAKVEVKSSDGVALATGALEVVDNHVDAATGTVRLKARFENADNKLWPGLAVVVDLTLGIDRQALVVPTAAVQHGVKGLYVYVVGDDDKASPHEVKVRRQNADEAEIASGLADGDRIVTSGQSMLRPGALVAIQNNAPRS